MDLSGHVAIYARVSTNDQSVDPQLRDLREYCSRRGWASPAEYVDHGISGAKDSRPGWNACWDAIQKRKVRALIVHALDRIGRSLPHLVKIINYFTQNDLTLVSYRENIDLATASGRMLAGIFSVMAEYERSIISERTKAGLRAARAKGKQIGRRARYFDKEKAAELRAKGWGQVRIAKVLGVGVGRVHAWVSTEYHRPRPQEDGTTPKTSRHKPLDTQQLDSLSLSSRVLPSQATCSQETGLLYSLGEHAEHHPVNRFLRS